ncbi:hypothetical protein NKJ26_11840 [Mesorhizobium sp. M0152]|uniref:hypothetical protein n=1 Tax=Mesorhizobium sp. M0152 TaxID=2956898 RepID=UPI003337E5BE
MTGTIQRADTEGNAADHVLELILAGILWRQPCDRDIAAAIMEEKFYWRRQHRRLGSKTCDLGPELESLQSR